MLQRLTRARARLRHVLRGVIRSDGGAAAVEFALIITPFLMLMFAILEIGLIFVVSASLENAMDVAARTVRTGQFQSGASTTAAAFKTTICNNFAWPTSECQANLYVDVRTFTSFSSISAPQPVQNGTFNSSALTFNTGGPNDIVVVRAYYQWPLIVPTFSQALQQLNGGKALLSTTAAFRNEPYGT